jgi:phosphopantothenoylcysteine decarboxylase / phosphopantothenate---cysteine ligase
METQWNPLLDKRIVLGVCGSIAAYKAVLVLRLLQQAGAEIQVVMTQAAGQFVGTLTFQSLSRRPVLSNLWQDGEQWTQHVQTAEWADLILIAPATAHTMARLAHGLCDDMLSAIVLSARCPLAIAPAMDLQMYAHPATQANIERLRTFGYQFIAPESGYLASGLEGQGRLASPENIVAQVAQMLQLPNPSPANKRLLAGKRLLITAGPTVEPLDPVRYLSNYSTGKMGVALAQAAMEMGAEVCLVAGPLQVPIPPNATRVPVQTAQEMFEAVQQRYQDADLIICAAAVCDYRPSSIAPQKIKKTAPNEPMSLQLEPTPDILSFIGHHKQPHQCVIGFALETERAMEHAQAKLNRKQADWIVLNSLADTGAGFGHDTNQVVLISAQGHILPIPLANKLEIARQLLTLVVENEPSLKERPHSSTPEL